MRWLSRLRSLWSGVRSGSELDAETYEEFRLHMELRAADLEAEGLSPEDAMRRARHEFGIPARLQAEVRVSRGLRGVDALRFSWLDFKLGFRMLARHPGLTLVGTLAIAVGIALGTTYFEAVNKWQNPRIPFPDGERVVSILNWDREAVAPERRSLYDFEIWRDQLRTVEDPGAAVIFERPLAAEDGAVEPVRGAEITASAFRLARVSPVLGRTLIERDERLSEPPVVVIGETLWRNRFGSDPQIVGRAVKLGAMDATIVGVMPEGFGFPVSERIWAPLRADGAGLAPRSGPNILMFGRLAPGATLREAEAELATISRRIAADHPESHEHISPRVTRYARPLSESGEALIVRRIMYFVNAVFVALLAIMCANVATLVFARTATRGWEIAVRNALGASRGRIIGQLFAEALVLTALAAVVGLLLARLALGYGLGLVSGGGGVPFWIDNTLSLRTVLYAGVLTLIGAGVVGILPALRVTRGSLHDAMRNEGAGRAGLRFGGFWTGVIVVQIALTVALLPLAAGGVLQSNRFSNRAEAIGAERFLMAAFAMDHQDYGMDSLTMATRVRSSYEELERRILAEPGVEHVTFADRLPVMDQFKYQIEVDSASAPADGLRTSTGVNTGPGYFATFGTSVVAGRGFAPGDFERGGVLIVNESFARHVFRERNPIGQRVRVLSGHGGQLPSEDWYEIVGMVRDFGWTLDSPHEQAAMYYPRVANGVTPIRMAIRVQDPGAFAPRLRSIATELNPDARLYDVQPLTSAGGSEARMNWALTSVAWLVGLVVLLLSATGIHALMAFTVARRTKEIGIRTALGARPGHLIASIFSRAFLQIALGVLLGSGVAALYGLGSSKQVVILAATVGVMLTAGLLACAVPLRRALRIQPTEALRAEA